MGHYREISREWLEEWAEIQSEVERTCARVAREMAKMRVTLEGEALAELKHEIEEDKDVLDSLARVREQVAGIFGHIAGMSEEAHTLRKKLQNLAPAREKQKPGDK